MSGEVGSTSLANEMDKEVFQKRLRPIPCKKQQGNHFATESLVQISAEKRRFRISNE